MQELSHKQFKDTQVRVEELEKKLADQQKKYDDSKRAYIDIKASYTKAQQDLEKFKGSAQEVNEKEIKDKYEALKVKYRVSIISSGMYAVSLFPWN